MNQERISEFVDKFNEYRNSANYEERRAQAAVLPYFKQIIQAAISEEQITNQTLTDLIQIFKYNCTDGLFDAKLNSLVLDDVLRMQIHRAIYETYQPGYTNAGKAAVSNLTEEQLATVKQFLINAFNVQTLQAAVKLCEEFEASQIPEVKKGIYSPWLFYINPRIFPIINNTHANFKKWLGLADSYPASILEFGELNKVINENDLGAIDAFAHAFREDGTVKFVKQIATNGMRFYKMSHGIFVKDPRFANEGMIKVLEDKNWICMGRYTGKGKGDLFMKAAIGDLVYVCYGGYTIRYIGKITSAWNPLPVEYAKLIDDDEEEFIYREVQILSEAINPDIRDLKTERAPTMPSGNSTFWEVRPEDFDYINEKLLIPKLSAMISATGNVSAQGNISNEEFNIKQKLKLQMNTILYGPPGTGKTYNSIDKAVHIAEGESGSHKHNKNRFDVLRKEGRIEFITFHQNYSYEDFVTGLKPDETVGILRFEKRNGIFKQIVERARQNWEKSSEYIALHPASDAAPLADFDHVFNSYFEKLIQEETEEIYVQMRTPSYKFKITSIDFETGRIKFTKQSKGTGHDLLVRNVKDIYNGVLDYPQEGLGIYYYPLVEQLKAFASTLKDPAPVTEPLKNYVLVIDEINRANISRIFGELITLIEEDKRLGKDNALTVTLPNGDKDFGVPPNLYIIGTMNTADKSIALVDIALRRRFDFIGYYPDYEVLAKDYPEHAELLQTINSAIYEKKKSADYLIGHAYFMNSSDTRDILIRKVIPLLMEYFMGRIDEVAGIFANTLWHPSYDTMLFKWDVTQKAI